ncbi:MAG: ComF family protein [Gammaproteobacteria bacterium]
MDDIQRNDHTVCKPVSSARKTDVLANLHRSQVPRQTVTLLIRASTDAIAMFHWTWIGHVLPTICLLCGARAHNMLNLCEGCHQDMPLLTGPGCRQCARPLSHGTVCGECLKRPTVFRSTTAALRYEGCTGSLIRSFKFNGDQKAGRILATLLARRSRAAEQPELLVPVPLSRKRLRVRGFDQSWELARQVAKLTGISADIGCVRRFSDRVPQSSLTTWGARRQNVRGVFHVEPSRVTNRHIAIVDDVMTSGATANSLANQLIRAGARRVDVWVACRAGLQARSGVQISH